MGERLLLVLVVHTRFGALFGSKFKYTNENIEWLNSDWIPTEYSESIEFWLIGTRLNPDWRLNNTINESIYWLFDWLLIVWLNVLWPGLRAIQQLSFRDNCWFCLEQTRLNSEWLKSDWILIEFRLNKTNVRDSCWFWSWAN